MQKISIIVPHYNSIDTLPKLIESVPANENMEIIIVDDLSTENSLDDLENLADKYRPDRNIIIITNNTGIKGPGGARNAGMAAAEGEWYLFVDSDDTFVGNWYPYVKKYLDTDVDMVFFSPTGINADTGEPSYRHMRYVDVVTKAAKDSSVKNITEMKYGFCTPWSKLYRSSVARDNDLHFGDTFVSEDVYFVTQFSYHAAKVVADTNTIYCVTRSSNTLTSAKRESDFDTRIDVMIWRYNYLKDRLSSKEFSYANMQWYAMAKLMDAIFDGWGFKKFQWVIKEYKKGGVKVFNAALFNPVSLIRNIEIELRLWSEINKKRKA